MYIQRNKFSLAIKHYARFASFGVNLINRIINIVPKLSQEQQLEILETVSLTRTNDELFHSIPRTVHQLYMDKKIQISRYLSYHLIDDIADICLSYY
jgi:hypothetical protein